jgi:hypothetical protein
MATPAIGTIPALPQYQPGALPLAGTEAFEIVNTTNATAAASYFILLSNAVGKVPGVLPSGSPNSNDLLTVLQASSGVPYSCMIGNLGIAAGNVPVGGSAGQILNKNSPTNYDASWSNITQFVTAGTALATSGTATSIVVAVASGGIGSTQIGTFAVQAANVATNAIGNVQLRQGSPLSVIGVAGNATANVADIIANATAGNVLQVNVGATGLIFGPASNGAPFNTTTLTNEGILFGQGTSTVGITAAGTTGYVLTGRGTALAPIFAQVSLTASVTGVLGVPFGGTNTSTLTQNGLVFGNGTSTVGITAAGATSLPLLGQGTPNAPIFGILPVIGGGTNTTTLTAHGVVIGQGTSTVTISAAGPATYIFAGNGTTLDPSFQSISSLMISTLSVTGGLTLLGLGTTGGSASIGSATVENIRYPNIQTAAYTVQATDLGSIIAFSTAALATCFLPQPQTSVGQSFAPGFFVDLVNFGSTAIFLAPASSNFTAIGAIITLNPRTFIRAISDGTNYQSLACGQLAVNRVNTAQSFSGGLRLTAYSVGTLSSGTYTTDSGLGPVQYLTNNGAFTMAAPLNDGELDVLVINSTSAGSITFAGFNVGSNTGDTYTTTSGNRFIAMIRRINGSTTYKWAALQ